MSKRTYVIRADANRPAEDLDHNDVQEGIDGGRWLSEVPPEVSYEEAEDWVLDLFADSVPIKFLDDFDIEARPIAPDDPEASDAGTVTLDEDSRYRFPQA